MKQIFLILSLIPFLAFSQYKVIDSELKTLNTVTDISGYSNTQYFIVQNQDIDTIAKVLNKYLKLIENNTRSRFAFIEEQAGSSKIKVRPQSQAYADRYEISIESVINGTMYSLMLSDVDDKNRDNARRIKKFLKLISQ
jgi:hypothetical protein